MEGSLTRNMATIDDSSTIREFHKVRPSAFFHSDLDALTFSAIFSKVARPVISVMDTSTLDILLNQFLTSTGIVA